MLEGTPSRHSRTAGVTASPWEPTATQVVPEHETEDKSKSSLPPATARQTIPSQTAAVEPTAIQKVGDEQEIAPGCAPNVWNGAVLAVQTP